MSIDTLAACRFRPEHRGDDEWSFTQSRSLESRLSGSTYFDLWCWRRRHSVGIVSHSAPFQDWDSFVALDKLLDHVLVNEADAWL